MSLVQVAFNLVDMMAKVAVKPEVSQGVRISSLQAAAHCDRRAA